MRPVPLQELLAIGHLAIGLVRVGQRDTAQQFPLLGLLEPGIVDLDIVNPDLALGHQVKTDPQLGQPIDRQVIHQ